MFILNSKRILYGEYVLCTVKRNPLCMAYSSSYNSRSWMKHYITVAFPHCQKSSLPTFGRFQNIDLKTTSCHLHQINRHWTTEQIPNAQKGLSIIQLIQTPMECIATRPRTFSAVKPSCLAFLTNDTSINALEVSNQKSYQKGVLVSPSTLKGAGDPYFILVLLLKGLPIQTRALAPEPNMLCHVEMSSW